MADRSLPIGGQAPLYMLDINMIQQKMHVFVLGGSAAYFHKALRRLVLSATTSHPYLDECTETVALNCCIRILALPTRFPDICRYVYTM